MSSQLIRTFLVLLTCSSLFAASPAYALEYEGVDFPERVKLAGSQTEIQLNGIGTRSKFIFDIYIGALYTRDKSSSEQIIIEEMTGPKRIMMHFLYEEVERDKLVDAWHEGFDNNNDDETLASLQARIDQFNAYFPTLKQGDQVTLDYVPRKGTTVTIKGNELGVIEGEDFFKALLKIWLGDEPADADLKEGMLGLD